MSDRLAELVRQRALVEQHLAWLNREIADAATKSLASATGAQRSSSLADAPVLASAVVAADASPSVKDAGPRVHAAADEILAQYEIPPAALKEDVRKGCLLYMVAAFLVLALGLTIFYFTYGSR